MKHKLAIAYRIYPLISKSPAIHSDDKYKLSELCIASFARALEGIDYKLWAILDKCPPEYKELFNKYFTNIEFVEMSGVGNKETFRKQMDILQNQDYSEYIYFAEDDYFYLPNAMQKMMDFMKSNAKPHFLTTYDHLDYYIAEIHKHKKTEVEFEGQKWRSENGTCMTFLTTKSVLKKTRKVFITYAYRNFDTSLWIALTKLRAYNPIDYIKPSLQGMDWFKSYCKLWLYTPYFPFIPKYKLYAPVPSLSTHLEKYFLAPNIDWQEEFKKIELKD